MQVESGENMEKETNETQQESQPTKPAGKFIRIKPFAFIMLFFMTILVTAGLTIFALTFGEKKVVEVAVPVERQEFKQLYDAFDKLNSKYYTDIDQEAVINGAINGMFEALDDPYTDFLSKEESDNFNSSLSSSFEGIGAEIEARNDYIMVVSPIKNSPAEKAGILPKDMILAVDGESIQGYSASQAVALIRGEKGSTVTLTVQREGLTEPMEMKIVRDVIPIETVYGDLDENKIAHIQITTFSEKTAEELTKILADFEKQGMESIILDVRQNPGGYLVAAIDIANLFLEEGKTILQIETRDGQKELYQAEGGKKYDLPITVLIDEGSASASEILAAALKEEGGAEVIGVKSFGKGTVQTVEELNDGSSLKYTNGKWLTPKGNWVNEKGLSPTIEVKYPEYMYLSYIDPSLKLAEGTVNPSVESAEGMLVALGYTIDAVDQSFTQQTSTAVRNFQKEQNLEITGVVTGETTHALMDALSKLIEEEDPMLLKAKEVLTKSE